MKILFLCTGNACRSQLAEGWSRRLKKDRIEPYSAGVSPHGFVDPRILRVMAEAGIDISDQRSKHVSELEGIEFDYVVTLCDNARKNCPPFPAGTVVLHVGFDAPPVLAAGAKTEEEALVHYRRIRDEIGAFVETLPVALA
ncbi:MAG: arsenate reductase ArsC [Syntrophobacteraceae bacterium]